VNPGEAQSDDELPASDEVVAEFRRALGEPDYRAAGTARASLLELLRSNLEQWKLEDRARGPDVDDAVVARTKRAIDRLNTQRHELVESIDGAIDGTLTQSVSAEPATESPAMAFDRLSVLVIRIHHTELAAGEEAPDAELHAARLPVLYRQLADLQHAIDCLIEDVRRGARRFVPYQSLKLYGN
jgi:hypothetical protein